MKRTTIFLTLGLLIALTFSSCDKEFFCQGRGELTVENQSQHTVHEILIDGTSYGTIDPDETKTIELPAGEYTLQFKGISGGSGCSPSELTIDACGEVGRACRY